MITAFFFVILAGLSASAVQDLNQSRAPRRNRVSSL